MKTNLSEKIIDCEFIHILNVKEFIKKLKGHIHLICCEEKRDALNRRIKRLAGDKLIESSYIGSKK